MSFHSSSNRREKRSPALLLALATALAACSQDGPPPEPPLSDEAMAAVVVDPGISRERLARQVDELFTSPDIGETQAVLVLREGEIVAERYAEGFDEQTIFPGWSLSKNVTAVLIGMMVADGRLALDDPAPITAWQRTGDPRGGVTLRHLLQMRSGLRYGQPNDPIYADPTDRMVLLEGRDDMGAWAIAQPLEDEPGSTFRYSDPSIMILSAIATDLLEPDGSADARQQSMAEFVDARLAVPLGMETLVGEYDASGTLIGGSQFWASARDWAIFADFLRKKGSVQGAQIVPRRWVEFMASPSPASESYGATLWLNHHGGEEPSAIFRDAGAETIFAGIGRFGQYMIVSPDQRLVLVRLGVTEQPQRARLAEEMADIFALYPGR
ncbi:serine hydrolase [Erythrobacter alti]|uniref:serine hydrolase domain-containing protein n=1 Tax=Erythrobacter alti TaxID=1896145 RepID=UPI0030F42E37